MLNYLEKLTIDHIQVLNHIHYNKINLNNIFQVDMLAMSALYNPITVGGKLSKSDYYLTFTKYYLTFTKIDNIFKFAISNSNTNLILGALACGVFNNPPFENNTNI